MHRKSVIWGVLIFDCIAIATAMILSVYKEYWPDYYFGEGQFITWISFSQLILISLLACTVFAFRVDKTIITFWKAPALIWLFITAGFVFLAYDEVWKFHESLDKTIHYILNIKETGFTDRLDDIIVGVYGIIGVVMLILYRKELKQFKAALPLLISAIVIMFIMVAIDTFNNRTDLIKMLISERRIYRPVNKWLCASEDSFKIIAEGLFIAAFYYMVEIAYVFRRNKKNLQ